MAVLKNLNRIVVKVGTSTLTYETGKTNIRRMAKLASVLSDLVNSGTEVVLVTSGAIGVGVGKLGLKVRPQDTPGRQAAAAVGQCELMFMYDKFFSEYGHTIAQLLVTRSDFEDEERRANLSNTFKHLFEYGAVPIVNENDSVEVEEIKCILPNSEEREYGLMLMPDKAGGIGPMYACLIRKRLNQNFSFC